MIASEDLNSLSDEAYAELLRWAPGMILTGVEMEKEWTNYALEKKVNTSIYPLKSYPESYGDCYRTPSRDLLGYIEDYERLKKA